MQSSVSKTKEGIKAEATDRRSGLKLIVIFCFWTLFGLLYANQYYFGLNDHESLIPWWRLVAWQLSVYYAWGLLTPIILWLGGRFPIERARWGRALLIHLSAGVVLSAIHTAAYTGITRMADVYPRWKMISFSNQYVHFLWMYFHLSLFTYFAILGISLAFDYYRKYRERELQAARLKSELAEAQLQAL